MTDPRHPEFPDDVPEGFTYHEPDDDVVPGQPAAPRQQQAHAAPTSKEFEDEDNVQRIVPRDYEDEDHIVVSREPRNDPRRRNLLVSAWRERELPPRDYLLESTFCTTTRWLISGDTGIGKTLFALELGFAMSASANFLNWKGVAREHPPRVMYLDGELPAETMKERIEAAATIYGDVNLYAYNRDDLGPAAMPPLNRPEGQKWLWQEIETVKPDVIIFDSLMCLLLGPLAEEETWQPCAPMIRQLSARRIAQIWLNHTGHDATRGFGTKTKEWEFDLVSMLSKHETDDTAVIHTFTKARLRTPKTAGLFKPQLIRRTEEHGWTAEATTVSGPKGSASARKREWLTDVYRDLSDDVPAVPGHNNVPVRKVAITALRQAMIRRGYLATEDGKLPDSERKAFQRAREDLIGSRQFAGDADHLWSIK